QGGIVMASETLTVGSAAAAPGRKATGHLEVPGTSIRMPVTVVNGAAAGPRVCITAGVHGGEYPGIEAAIRTAASLDPAHVRGQVVVVHIVDVPSFQARSIYICPLDGKNPNRVFPGNPAGTASERLAHTLFSEVIVRADYYVDLHGGDINEALVPFTILLDSGTPEVDAAAMDLARVYGIKYVVRGRVSGGTYSAAAQRKIPAILAEAGGQGLLEPAALALHLRGLQNVLKHLKVVSGAPEPVEPIVLLGPLHWVSSEHTGLFYPNVVPGDRVTQGQRVGEIRDYFGASLAEIVSPGTGIVLFTVTTPATNPSDPLFAVGAPA
ncbi:MAG TPA: M14 family metallopeptidase, partial [bacterium]|nr:M14 family metallopeptidase [bacterium]